MTTREIWREVPSLPAVQVSSLGRVMVTPYESPMPRGGVRTYGGYPHYGTWVEKERRYIYRYKGRTYKLARLICEAFHGPPPSDRMVCMHLDEDSRNNRPENLQWGTQKENLNAPGFLAYCRGRTGDNSPYTKGKRRTNA